MLDFVNVTTEHRELIKKVTQNTPSGEMCDFTFGNMFSWSVSENTRIAQKDGFVFLRSRFNGVKSYAFPLGEGDMKTALEILETDAKERQCEFSFFCLSPGQADFLKSIYGNRFTSAPQRDFFDYVYERESLAFLRGRKLHSKKNHVNSFVKKHSFTYEEINKSNISECLDFSRKWHEAGARNPKLDEERLVIDRAFEHFEELGLKGGIVRVDGAITAYAVGEEMADGKTFCTHFEKADKAFPDAYAVINKLFAENSLGNYLYINREDDAGSQGLRKAKTSYNPQRLVEKYYGKIV